MTLPIPKDLEGLSTLELKASAFELSRGIALSQKKLEVIYQILVSRSALINDIKIELDKDDVRNKDLKQPGV